MKPESRPVIVTTSHRGIFFGYLESDPNSDRVTLTNARMVIYFSAETHGVLGLAANGPAKGSRVSPVVPRIVLQNVTAVMDCTEKAREAHEAEPWN